MVSITKNKWDSVIPPEKLWEQYERIIKPNGAIVLFGQDKFTAKMMLSNEKLHRYNLIWSKILKSGFLNANRMPLREHEDIMVFYKKQPIYHPQMVKGVPSHTSVSFFDVFLSIENRTEKKNMKTKTAPAFRTSGFQGVLWNLHRKPRGYCSEWLDA